MSQTYPLGSNIVVLRHVPGRGIVPSGLVEPPHEGGPRLRINVLFTDAAATEVALTRALALATDLQAETQIIVPYVVPYPLALECPAVPLEFICSRLRVLAGSVGGDPYVNVYLCRDVMDLLLKLLPVDSITVLGARRPWLLRRRAEKIARVLRKNGSHVILVPYP